MRFGQLILGDECTSKYYLFLCFITVYDACRVENKECEKQIQNMLNSNKLSVFLSRS